MAGLIELRGYGEGASVAARCDQRCYDAKSAGSAHCSCVCGGVNHGVGYVRARDNVRREGERMADAYAKRHGLTKYHHYAPCALPALFDGDPTVAMVTALPGMAELAGGPVANLLGPEHLAAQMDAQFGSQLVVTAERQPHPAGRPGFESGGDGADPQAREKRRKEWLPQTPLYGQDLAPHSPLYYWREDHLRLIGPWLGFPQDAWSEVPAPLREGVDRYLVCRMETGSFLRALLENDLGRAMTRATPESLLALPLLYQTLFTWAPSEAWGTPARVSAWLGGRAAAEAEQAAFLLRRGADEDRNRISA